MSLQVALILDANFADRLQPIALQMPVWIVKSAANTKVVNELRAKCVSCDLTEFFQTETESVSEMFHRIIFSLDDHYNEFSQKIPYRLLQVYGLDSELVEMSILNELDFSEIYKTEYGFVMKKAGKGK